MKVTVLRLRTLAAEIGAMLTEGDARASVDFALKLDDIVARLQPALEASGRSEDRLKRQHCDKDGRGNPKVDESQKLRFSTIEQQEKLETDLTDLFAAEIEIPDAIPRISKAEIVGNGLGCSPMRLARLRPILDLDEHIPPDQQRTHIIVSSGRPVPDA